MDYSKNPIQLAGSEISDYHYDNLHGLCASSQQVNGENLASALEPLFEVYTEVNAEDVATWPHFYLLAKWSDDGERTMHIVPSISSDVYDITSESGDNSDITAFDLAIIDRSTYPVAMKIKFFDYSYEYIVTNEEISRLKGCEYKHSPLRHDIAMSTECFNKAVLVFKELGSNRYGINFVTPWSGDGEEDFDKGGEDRIIINKIII